MQIQEATMPATINLTATVEDQFLADVLTTAVESGGHALWYWEGFSMIDFRRASNNPEAPKAVMADVVLEPLSVWRIEFACDHIARDGVDKNGQGQYQIDLEDVAKGIQWIVDGTVPVAQRLVDMVTEAVASGDCDIDAEGADVIVQAAAFKELVFG
jgi:hypothetical protein